MIALRIKTENVVILAGALFVLAAGFYLYQTVSTVVRSEALYVEAQDAVKDGDVRRAEQSLVQAISINPSHEAAKDLLIKVKQGIDPRHELAADVAPDKSSDGMPDTGATLKTRNRKQSLSPGKQDSDLQEISSESKNEGEIPGFKLVRRTEGTYQSSSIFTPLDKGSPAETVEVRKIQHNDADSASEHVFNLRYAYPMVQQKIMICGHMAYHGTDGKKTAILTWARANESIEIVAVSSGDSTAGLLNMLTKLASELFG